MTENVAHRAPACHPRPPQLRRRKVCSIVSGVLAAALETTAHGQVTTRLSLGTAGNETDSASSAAAVSADGRYVAFQSFATNLVAGDSNGLPDIFLRDRVTGVTRRVSVSSAGDQANGRSVAPAISGDGRYVAFRSAATNLVAGDTNGVEDVFVHDRDTGQTARVSVDSQGNQAALNAGEPPRLAISANGRFVAFDSGASNLVPGDTNAVQDVFVHDRETGDTSRVSIATGGAQANGASFGPAISADGQVIAFDSAADNLVAGDTLGFTDVFVHDRGEGQTTRVSVTSDGAQADGLSGDVAISADGQIVAFESFANNLAPRGRNQRDVFVHDRVTRETVRVSEDSAGDQGNSDSVLPAVSGDGRFVAYVSLADNLVPGDTNNARDVLVFDRNAGQTTRASVDSAGIQGNGDSSEPALSADGRLVVFDSFADNLVAGDGNFSQDVFARGPSLSPTAFTLTIGQTALAIGETLRVGAMLQNFAPDFGADLFLGILSPDGETALFINGLSPVTGRVTALSADPSGFPALLTSVVVPNGLSVTLDEVFSLVIPAGAPPGTYTPFLVLTPPGALADGVIDPGDILLLEAKPVRVGL